MKDLYAALGIGSDASETEVEAVLEVHPERSVYSAILLHGEKRALYDRAYTALKMIGELRHRLGIDSGNSWFLENSPDFAPRQNVAVFSKRSRVGKAQAASLQKTIHTAQPESLNSVKAAHTRWLAPALFAILVVILAALVIVFY